MAYDYSDLITQAKNWAEQLSLQKRLQSAQLQAILDFDLRSPDSLFQDQQARPLIVAFMGGTGVGKSSLLNRLAGQDIANTGVERPTSREVTLYHHQSINIQKLPEGLPLDKINISRHEDESRRNIIWIDMPDFDSVELENKKLVLEWLPHIDVLLYVVSPERYRDNKAWQLLLSEGAKHAWVFVLNQWDRGVAAQYDDFKRQLTKAGFSNPIVFRTVCLENEQEDEFTDLVDHLQGLANGHTVQALEQLGMEARTADLLGNLTPLQSILSEQDYDGFEKHFQQQWRQTSTTLQKAFLWPIAQLAQSYADTAKARPDVQIWDQWAANRFNDFVDGLIVKAAQSGIAPAPLRAALAPLRDNIENNVREQSELFCRQALINPGNRLQRWFLKLMKFCQFILPLMTMCWVGYQVFRGYYLSALEGLSYLGVEFAIHSFLLVLLSWLLPYFLRKQLQPSLQKSAVSGLQKGVDIALLQAEAEIKQIIDGDRQQSQHELQQLEALIVQCQSSIGSLPIDHQSPLNRMLMES